MSITSIITFLLILSILVFIHEAGHFAVAKLFKIKVQEFGIGFPPRIFGINYKQTLYSLNALPLGGFVKLPEHDSSLIKTTKLISEVSPWKKLCVLSAGPIMNVVFAIILFTILFATSYETFTGTIVVTKVEENSPAFHAGIRTGDHIVAIDNLLIDSLESISNQINSRKGKTSKWTILQGETQSTVFMTPRNNPPVGEGPTGITIALQNPRSVKMSHSILESVVSATQHLFSTMGLIKSEVFNWVQGTAKPQLTGPIGIAQVTGEVAKSGLVPLIELTALLSLNLAILNILPIPMLDGGRIIFVLFEIISRGKKVPKEKENTIHAFGLLLLIGIMIIVTYQDIVRLFNGESLIR